jgi:hypothetical protein
MCSSTAPAFVLSRRDRQPLPKGRALDAALVAAGADRLAGLDTWMSKGCHNDAAGRV